MNPSSPQKSDLIAEYGTQKIKTGMAIFTHCYSETVLAILIRAWDEGKKFTVHQTETRPAYLGRRTAITLNEAGIPIEHYVDAAAENALKKTDLFLFGCHAIASRGTLINKTGTNMYLEMAKKYNIPAYACTDTSKYNPTLKPEDAEKLPAREPVDVWPEAPEGVTIQNPSYEACDSRKITGVICEKGILTPEELTKEFQTQ